MGRSYWGQVLGAHVAPLLKKALLGLAGHAFYLLAVGQSPPMWIGIQLAIDRSIDGFPRTFRKKVKKITKYPKGILIKFPKKRQDLRVDLPTIGLETIKQCKTAGLKGIVLKHKSNIFLNKRQSVKYANRNKMFILIK